jgi:hypothetical protein
MRQLEVFTLHYDSMMSKIGQEKISCPVICLDDGNRS